MINGTEQNTAAAFPRVAVSFDPNDAAEYADDGRDRCRLLWASEFLSGSLRPWGLKPYYRAGARILWSAETGIGKTLVNLDYALHVALGLAWCGLHTRSGPVVYIVGEAADDVRERILAWLRFHDLPATALDGRFFVLTSPIALVGEGGRGIETVETLTGAIESLCAAPGLIVIDPLNYSLAGANENDNGHITKMYAALNQLQTDLQRHFQAAKTTILLVHHTGRSKKASRGAYAFDTCADATFSLRRGAPTQDGAALIALCPEKVRSTGHMNGALYFRIVEQEIGTDEFDEPYTSAVAVFVQCGPPPASTSSKPRSKGQRKKKQADRLDQIRQILKSAGKPVRMKELAETTKLQNTQLTGPLKKLIATGEIVKLEGREGYALAN